MTTPISVRPATPADIPALDAFDELKNATPEAVAAGELFVAVSADNQPIGYVRFNHSFFWKGWVETLVVDPRYRRRGAATALLGHVESICTAPKIFVSTSLCNTAMQTVLARCGYRLSGVIQDLGPQPELFYFKQLR